MDTIARFIAKYTERFVVVDPDSLERTQWLREPDGESLTYLRSHPGAWASLPDIMAIRNGTRYDVICGGHRLLLMKQGLAPWTNTGVLVHVLSTEVTREPTMVEMVVVCKNAGTVHPESFHRIWKVLRAIHAVTNPSHYATILVPDIHRIRGQLYRALDDSKLAERLYTLSTYPGYTDRLLWGIVEMVDNKAGRVVGMIASL
jgi:hypothetical protein